MYVIVDLIGSMRNSYVASILMASLTKKIVIISTYVVGSTNMQCFIADGTKQDLETLRNAGFILEECSAPRTPNEGGT